MHGPAKNETISSPPSNRQPRNITVLGHFIFLLKCSKASSLPANMAETPTPKSVHTIVLDAGPILKNNPPLSTLLARCEELVITPSVVAEIRDPDARQRVETLYLPFLKQRTPSPKSVAFLSEFARKTGDRTVLSRTDLEVLALAYEVECERNGGDWRLRSVPGQKQVNGKPPAKVVDKEVEQQPQEATTTEESAENPAIEAVTEELKNTSIEGKEQEPEAEAPAPTESETTEGFQSEKPNEKDEAGDESDGGEWITPSNLKKRQARDEVGLTTATPEPKVMQVATMTTDFAVSIP